MGRNACLQDASVTQSFDIPVHTAALYVTRRGDQRDDARDQDIGTFQCARLFRSPVDCDVHFFAESLAWSFDIDKFKPNVGKRFGRVIRGANQLWAKGGCSAIRMGIVFAPSENRRPDDAINPSALRMSRTYSRPAAVNSTDRPDRVKSGAPRAASRSAIRWLMADGVVFRSSAAARNVP